MRLNFTLKTAVIVVLFLSCYKTYAQSTPFISQLEGLNEGKEAKISLTDGVDGKTYAVQYRLKNSVSWLNSQIKIKKGAAATITGLESNKNYCFRAIQKDSVTNTEVVSNEVCSINLKSTLLSDSEVKLEWSKIDITDLSRLSVTYMEEGGINMNTIPISLSDTTFIFENMECSKKYKFNISTTSRLNNQNKRTTIISYQVLADPASLKTLPVPKGMGIVSVASDSVVKYNLFTLSNVYRYEFYKSTNGSEMIKIGESKNNYFDDKNVDTPKNHYCYAYKSINACGTKSELSEKACTIYLSSRTYGRLSWTPFTILKDNRIYKAEKAVYNVQLVNNEGAVMSTIDNTQDTTISINTDNFPVNWETYKFRVLAQINGELYYDSQQRIPFPMYSYSNTKALFTILGNEFTETNLSVFPNPAEDNIRIKSASSPVSHIELIDMKGQVIHKTEISGETFNVSAFEKGKYVLRLYDTNNRLLSTKSIVKW